MRSNTEQTARRVLILLVMSAVAGFGTYHVVFAFLTHLNRVELASRPEVENWAMPEYGVAEPSFIWAIVVAVAVLAIGVASVKLRSNRLMRAGQ